MSADFRQVAIRGKRGRSERLFRAAVAAFCALTRPTRREIAQLDDLTLPLFDSVSAEGRRFAAAALSECEDVPPVLVRRLTNEPVEIAAPLLVRSRALCDVDLIRLIGRHGLPHARAIARRPHLNPAIGSLLDALKDPEIRRLRGGRPDLAVVGEHKTEQPPARAGAAAEDARRRLREVMLPARGIAPADSLEPIAVSPSPDIYPKLLDTALSGRLPLFQTALADALGLEFAAVRVAVEAHGHANLLVALRALELREEQAFLLAAAIHHSVFDGPAAIRLFLSRYRMLDRDTALRRIEDWKAGSSRSSEAEQTSAANGARAASRRVS